MPKDLILEDITKLNACPECGSYRAVLKTRVTYGTYYYQCKKCGYTPPQVAHSMDEAVKMWNDGKGKR